MSRLSLLILLTACTQKGSFEGRVLDPVAEGGLADLTVVARSATTPSLDCIEIEATTDAEGRFTLEGLCAGGTYALESKDEQVALEDAPDIVGGMDSVEVVDMKGWQLPTGEGLFLYDGDTFAPLKPLAVVAKTKIWQSQQEVLYPDTLPTRVPVVDEGKHLVFSGARYADRKDIIPLVHSDRRRFGTPTAPEVSEPWWYIGVEFRTDTDFEVKKATVSKDGLHDLGTGDNRVRFVNYDAVPNGHYAVMGDKDTRTFIVNFGPELKAPGAE